MHPDGHDDPELHWPVTTTAVALLASSVGTLTQPVPVSPGLYTVTTNGHVTAIFESPDFAGMSEVSPDRRRIAFVQGPRLNGVWVVGVDGSSPRLAAGGAHPKYSPHWSPNGREVAFGVCAEQQCPPETDVVAASVGAPVVRALPGTLSSSWSSDGSLLAGAGGLDRVSHTPTHVIVGSASQPNHHAIAISQTFPPAPAFAPRGDLIAYVCPYQRVCVVHARSGRKQLVRGSASSPDVPRFAWAPDGEHLAVAVDHGGTYQISEEDLRTGELRPLAAIPFGVFSLSFARAGRKLVVASPAGITIVSTGGPTTRLLEPRGFVDGGPVWSPDGARLAFTSSSLTSSEQRIEVVRADGSHRHALTATQTGAATIIGFARSGQLIYEIR